MLRSASSFWVKKDVVGERVVDSPTTKRTTKSDVGPVGPLSTLATSALWRRMDRHLHRQRWPKLKDQKKKVRMVKAKKKRPSQHVQRWVKERTWSCCWRRLRGCWSQCRELARTVDQVRMEKLRSGTYRGSWMSWKEEIGQGPTLRWGDGVTGFWSHPLSSTPLHREDPTIHPIVKINLAGGQCAELRMSPGKVIVGDEGVEPIVPLGHVVTRLGCSLQWTSDELVVVHFC